MAKQIIIVLSGRGATLTSENIKDMIGSKRALKMGKLVGTVDFGSRIDHTWIEPTIRLRVV